MRWCLELENGLERALGNFGLVRRVGREPFAARDEGVDHHGTVMAVGSGAEHDCVMVAVFLAAIAKPLNDLGFGHRARHLQVALNSRFGRNYREQLFDRLYADFAQHALTVTLRIR
jgi:hypothetical protein